MTGTTKKQQAVSILPMLLIASAIIVPIAACGIGAMIFITLIGPDAFELQTALNISGMICGVSVILIMVGILPLWFISRINQRRYVSQLDPIFEALGLESQASGFGMSGREYHGMVDGRELHIYYYRRYNRSRGSIATYEGSVLDIHVYAPSVKTRAGISLRNKIGQTINRMVKSSKEVDISDPDYADVMAYAKDESWTLGFLEDEGAKTRILRLINEPSPAGLGQVIVFPEMLNVKMLRLPETKLTPEVAQQWIEDAIALAEIAEDQPAPFETLEPSKLERSVREGGTKQSMRALGLVLGVLVTIIVVSLLATGVCIGLSFLLAGV